MIGLGSQVIPILTFQLRDQFYGLTIDDVVEVAAMVELVATSSDRPEVLGLANRHGDVLPILDLRQIMGLPATEIDDRSLFVVVQVLGQLFGLVVDLVQQVEYIPVEKLRESTTSNHYIRGIISHKEQLIQVIAVRAILANYIENTRELGEG